MPLIIVAAYNLLIVAAYNLLIVAAYNLLIVAAYNLVAAYKNTMGKTVEIGNAHFNRTSNIWEWQGQMRAAGCTLEFCPNDSVHGKTGLEAARLASAALIQFGEHGFVPYSDKEVGYYTEQNPNFPWGTTSDGSELLESYHLINLYGNYILHIFLLGIAHPTDVFSIEE